MCAPNCSHVAKDVVSNMNDEVNAVKNASESLNSSDARWQEIRVDIRAGFFSLQLRKGYAICR